MPERDDDSIPAGAALALGASLLSAACGGGGGAGLGAAGATAFAIADPCIPPPPAPPGPSEAEAVRFLLQAALDAAPAEVERVRSLGYAGWLDQELARAPQAPTRYEWMLAQGYAVEENLNSFRGADAAIWRGLIAGSDPLRQRMALALSEILVVSMGGLPMTWRGFAVAHYADLLEAQAFGNFRALLEAVTLNAGHGRVPEHARQPALRRQWPRARRELCARADAALHHRPVRAERRRHAARRRGEAGRDLRRRTTSATGPHLHRLGTDARSARNRPACLSRAHAAPPPLRAG
jgi:hypothetical protein